MNWLGEIVHQFGPVIAIVPAFAAAYFTHDLGKRKSQQEQWESLYTKALTRAEKAEQQNVALQHKIDRYIQKYGDL
ncbi:hypothetical protein [Secundilactobacillus kimchicus]|uniref:Uncharacterized protein n=1 Tax=Secundilactobacillus kimchicus JCM 15530 TaxID=1302272 RepID=A0A0R1HN10_9LACO|nr:hypothetical protein [Secundilactobacillus kimchicus]KRK48205.1 hypothetical protein FC96_GL001944 [Secundilactobacillus kimchicus JCM 15530]MBT9670834.1 hypothetical protein [Secundilactobacillus kimchicus]